MRCALSFNVVYFKAEQNIILKHELIQLPILQWLYARYHFVRDRKGMYQCH